MVGLAPTDQPTRQWIRPWTSVRASSAPAARIASARKEPSLPAPAGYAGARPTVSPFARPSPAMAGRPNRPDVKSLPPLVRRGSASSIRAAAVPAPTAPRHSVPSRSPRPSVAATERRSPRTARESRTVTWVPAHRHAQPGCSRFGRHPAARARPFNSAPPRTRPALLHRCVAATARPCRSAADRRGLSASEVPVTEMPGASRCPTGPANARR
jgi:hypothetical protein